MKKGQVFLWSSFVLLLALGANQEVAKADTTDNASESVQVQSQVANDQPLTKATQDQPVATSNTSNTSNADANNVSNDQQTTPAQQTSVDTPVNQAATDSTDVTTTTAQNDTNSNQGVVTDVNGGVVTTFDKITRLYREDGSMIDNFGLSANSPWRTDKKLALNSQNYYRVSTDAYANSNDVTLTFGADADGIVQVKGSGAVPYSREDQGFTRNDANSNFEAGSLWKYNKTDDLDGLTYYQIGNNVWVNGYDAAPYVAYQNPEGWLQVENAQLQPEGPVGYELYNDVEGVKVWLVRRYFGQSNSHTIYDSSTAYYVRNFQRNHGLPVTGIVNLATWTAMGFSESSWYGIDSYVAPLQTNTLSTRSDHIEAMINQAYKYVGQPWISGASSSPEYGVDCSGLVVQALYASGINPSPVTSIQHAQPGNEWNSRMLFSDNRIHAVNFNDRQRGDLIFFASPSTGIVWHVGILLDANTMIDSWGPYVGTSGIYSGKGTIVGVKRVFS
ncbi:peptidoglycan-binding protein [Companilactobacillus baiquanensis]|uniref:Peptidoglycan-binding protein n=1 Tax=Companilactobacillus baiquanensis TaxID=2486005 RepID=A0ABW1USW6_9LACO|nr:peptidoglycan-binding protein [Companilactobacillus baiquanensis]